jgi:hypothetical protein
MLELFICAFNDNNNDDKKCINVEIGAKPNLKTRV